MGGEFHQFIGDSGREYEKQSYFDYKFSFVQKKDPHDVESGLDERLVRHMDYYFNKLDIKDGKLISFSILPNVPSHLELSCDYWEYIVHHIQDKLSELAYVFPVPKDYQIIAISSLPFVAANNITKHFGRYIMSPFSDDLEDILSNLEKKIIERFKNNLLAFAKEDKLQNGKRIIKQEVESRVDELFDFDNDKESIWTATKNKIKVINDLILEERLSCIVNAANKVQIQDDCIDTYKGFTCELLRQLINTRSIVDPYMCG